MRVTWAGEADVVVFVTAKGLGPNRPPPPPLILGTGSLEPVGVEGFESCLVGDLGLAKLAPSLAFSVGDPAEKPAYDAGAGLAVLIREEARVGMFDLSLNRGEGTLILRPAAVGVEKRGCWGREAVFSLLAAAGMREDDAVEARLRGGLVAVGEGAGSSSSTMTQFRRSSSFSVVKPVCRLLAAGRSGVSGEGSLSSCCCCCTG